MGETGTVTRFERDDAKADTLVDTGGARPRSCEHFEDCGSDGQPLPGDSAALQPGTGTGGQQALGYHDPVASNKVAEAGERRMYSRNPSTGAAVAAVYCKADGSVVIESMNGSPLMIKSTGTVTVDSPDVRLGKGGRQLAAVGDFAMGGFQAYVIVGGAPSPVLPIPAGGVSGLGSLTSVPVASQIVSGIVGVEGGTGDGSGE